MIATGPETPVTEITKRVAPKALAFEEATSVLPNMVYARDKYCMVLFGSEISKILQPHSSTRARSHFDKKLKTKMSSVDAVSIFAEGTFEEQVRQEQLFDLLVTNLMSQILELAGYLARGRSEEEQAAYLQPFHDTLSTPEGQKPIDEDEPRKKKIFTTVLEEVKGLGEGSERGP